MNYNPNADIRIPQGGGRKVMRVSDVKAMGPPAPMQHLGPYTASTMEPQTANISMAPMMSQNTTMTGNNYNIGMQPSTSSGYNNRPTMPMPTDSYSYTQQTSPVPSNIQQQYQTPMPGQSQYGINMSSPMYAANTGSSPGVGIGFAGTSSSGSTAGSPNPMQNQFGNTLPQLSMFQQPIVQDMAMQYGQRLADQGKQLVENQFEKWVPVSKLKYYFSVDNRYVINKLRLLFFPYTHKDWSLKYDQDNPVQPRYDINAPDLYIPTMAYITYVVVAGLMLGIQNRFTPEQIGMQASSALAYSVFELVVYSITMYVVNIKTSLKTLDLLAFSGYKFVVIVGCLLVSVFFHRMGYYVALIYSSFSLGIFLLRTLKTKVLHETTPASTDGNINYDPYGNPQQLDYTSGGRKRKLYFLFLIVGGQALFSFLLSKHLYIPDPLTINASNLKL